MKSVVTTAKVIFKDEGRVKIYLVRDLFLKTL